MLLATESYIEEGRNERANCGLPTAFATTRPSGNGLGSAVPG